jgi:hypothetical protein
MYVPESLLHADSTLNFDYGSDWDESGRVSLLGYGLIPICEYSRKGGDTLLFARLAFRFTLVETKRALNGAGSIIHCRVTCWRGTVVGDINLRV